METQFQTVSLSERYQRGDMWKQGMGAEEEEGEGRTGCVEDVAAVLWLRQHVGFLEAHRPGHAEPADTLLAFD